MTVEQSGSPIVAVLKAIADPIRWRIVTLMADCDELACTTLEITLPVSKSTISYHIKILYDAGLIDIRRDGKFFFYHLRHGVINDMLEQMRSDVQRSAPAALR